MLIIITIKERNTLLFFVCVTKDLTCADRNAALPFFFYEKGHKAATRAHDFIFLPLLSLFFNSTDPLS